MCCTTLLLAALVGCGSDDDGTGDAGPSVGAELGATFAAAAADAPTDDATTCFVLDDEAAGRIVAALDLDPAPTLIDSANLSGIDGSPLLQCSFTPTRGADVHPVGLVVVQTDETLDEYAADVLDTDDPPEQLEGSSDGLQDDTVTVFARDGFQQAVWVEDGVRVQLGASEEDADADALFAALAIVVDEMGRVLGSG